MEWTAKYGYLMYVFRDENKKLLGYCVKKKDANLCVINAIQDNCRYLKEKQENCKFYTYYYVPKVGAEKVEIILKMKRGSGDLEVGVGCPCNHYIKK